jgi:hypothetical protein
MSKNNTEIIEVVLLNRTILIYKTINTHENGLTVQNILSFYYLVFSFVERHRVNFPCLHFILNMFHQVSSPKSH